MSVVLLDHGEGGAASARLLSEVFLRYLGTPEVLEDAAVVPGAGRLAISTDSFVVRPAFFPGGNIGKLAVCGTVNDLAVMGASPRYLTCGFILEEGLELAKLELIVQAMAATAAEAGVTMVAGDTKVVGRGEVDGVYINTTGVGFVPPDLTLSAAFCQPGDRVLISGPVGDHGTAVMLAREGFGIQSDLVSDCQPLGDLATEVIAASSQLRCMRDPTRGGLATTLIELCEASDVGIVLDEPSLPIRREVRAATDLLGLDPLYVACEGRLIAVTPADQADAALAAMRAHPRGIGAAIVGSVVAGVPKLVLETAMGGRRPLVALEGAQLPRIC